MTGKGLVLFTRLLFQLSSAETSAKLLMTPTVSVVVLNWQSPDLARMALETARASLEDISHDLVVVENGSTNYVDERFVEANEVTRLAVRKNVGVSRGRNLGINASQGDYILILDDDARVRSSLKPLIDFMEAHKSIGVVGPLIRNSADELMFTCRKFPTLADKVGRRLARFGRTRLDDSEYRNWDHDDPALVDYVIGACQLVRRTAFLEVGPYDPSTFYGPEDVDLCLRMWKQGWQVAYCPEAELIHDERRSTTKVSVLTLRHVWALARFYSRHQYLFSRRRLYERLGRESASPTPHHPRFPS